MPRVWHEGIRRGLNCPLASACGALYASCRYSVNATGRRISKLDIVDRLKAASECEGDLPRDEMQALLIEAADAMEFLRSRLEPLEDIRPEDLPPQGRA
jgi:hypothetical protein